jgi:hypothetical protein
MSGPRVELTPDFVDRVVVERNLAGRDPGRELTSAEERQVIHTLRAKAFTDNAIALHLGCRMSRITTLMRPKRGKR